MPPYKSTEKTTNQMTIKHTHMNTYRVREILFYLMPPESAARSD